MKKAEDEILWNLDDLEEIKTYSHQSGFYQDLGDLGSGNILQNAIYQPNELHQISDHKKTKISNKKFRWVSFSKTKIKGISFQNCVFHQCLFIASEISDCEFHNCQFILTNTYKISISDTYLDPKCFEKCLIRNKDQNIGVHLYQMLLKNSAKAEQTEFARDANFLLSRWRRYQDRYKIKKYWGKKDLKNILICCMKFVGSWFWEQAFGSGIRFRYFVRVSLIALPFLTWFNFNSKEEFGLMYQNQLITSYADALYFTVISLTTLGYGDIIPTTECGKLFASFQSVVGFFLFATLASMLFHRISR